MNFGSNHNKRIVLMCSNYAWTVYIFRMPLVRKLREKGYAVHLLTQFDDYLPKIKDDFDHVYPLFIDRSGINPFNDMLTFFHIFKILYKVRPNIFLTYTIKPVVYGGIAARILNIINIPVITGLGTAFLHKGWLRNFVCILYRYSLFNAFKVFFLNHDDKNLFLHYNIISKKSVEVLPGEGIDLKHFYQQPLPSRNIFGRCKFLLIARMLWDKGVGEYVEAARTLKKRYPNVSFCLLGFLDAQNPTAICRNQMNKWVSEGVINYMGVCDDVRDAIKSADCVVLPSYREGLPRSLLEAAAMCRPIVTTNAVGCRVVIDDGSTGFLCKVKDATDLASKMETIIQMPFEERLAMGCRGREKVAREFDQIIVINQYIETFKLALT